ncbi:hypothetical protein BD289DRAFT_334320, partial [Coniella lustricola]
MCYQIVELYAACHCPYFTHAVDRCSLYPNHNITQRVIYVGYACQVHQSSSAYGGQQYATPYEQQQYSDSGYGS